MRRWLEKVERNGGGGIGGGGSWRRKSGGGGEGEGKGEVSGLAGQLGDYLPVLCSHRINACCCPDSKAAEL